jgi:hypothetical protein
MSSTPKWTVLYNGEFCRCYAFFDDRILAHQFYTVQSAAGLVPTLRPFHPHDWRSYDQRDRYP